MGESTSFPIKIAVSTRKKHTSKRTLEGEEGVSSLEKRQKWRFPGRVSRRFRGCPREGTKLDKYEGERRKKGGPQCLQKIGIIVEEGQLRPT